MSESIAVIEVIADTFGLSREQIGPEMSRDNIPEWDSVGHLNLMLALEDTFDIRLSLEEMTRLTSVAAILDHVERTCTLD